MILITALGTPRRDAAGDLQPQALHIHPGCPGAGCEEADTVAVNHLGEAYAVMRTLKSGWRLDAAKGRYVRNRIMGFRLSGDAIGEYAREEVQALPQDWSHPDHERYGEYRAKLIAGAPAGKRAVTECSLMAPGVARALGMTGVHLWEDVADQRRRIQAAERSERVNETSTATLAVGVDNQRGEPVYVRTLPADHPVYAGKTTEEVFRGYGGSWFTVPGDFPATLAEEFQVERQTYAVYESADVVRGALVWVVREAFGARRIVGTSTESRRVAVREALSMVASERYNQAADIVKARSAPVRQRSNVVRIAIEGGAWVLHVKCACVIPEGDAVGESASVSEAAQAFATGTDAWSLCGGSPRVLFTADRTGTVGRITGHGARGSKGEPCVFVAPTLGGPRRTVALSGIGASSV
ncbi:hypothetical protein AB0O47_39660 [Streptomyces noursei]|uniref:hypothetical protein n=1 Tax=Streptomyces noursei TaxID=1971 RepID=UPI00344F68E2